MELRATSSIPLQQIAIDDPFWSKYVGLVQDVVIPYQWKALNDQIPEAEASYAIHNFKVTAGDEEGEFGGLVFQDSDLAKWLEAVSYSLAAQRDAQLEQLADEAIDLIIRAQQPDGYLNTYFTLKEPEKRWTNIYECHELYCAGHMIEAAVAYYQATGKRAFLDSMCRLADHIDSVFGPNPDQIHGYPGHQEIELALVKLYEATNESRYLRLSEYFINERGTSPSFFVLEWERRERVSHWHSAAASQIDLMYNQSHLPVREQDTAVGHSVRAVYMYTAMADLVRHSGDLSLYNACVRLWNNIVQKQMYVTGGIGSTHHGEAFSFDYDLPNDTVYAETCASVGLIFFAHRMLRLEVKSEYADVMERALYNLVIGSMTLDGTRYFYVNPLEVFPEACQKNPGKHHVKVERQKWFACSCCPPNVARLIASLGQYIYTANEDTVYVHLYIGSRIDIEVDGERFSILQHSALPWQGGVRFTLSAASQKRFRLALRLPDWCGMRAQLNINGESVSFDECVNDGYVVIDRVWADSDTVEWTMDMSPKFLYAHPGVRANAGKIALQRGPLVYCCEQADNGPNLSSLRIATDAGVGEKFNPSLFDGVVELYCSGVKDDDGDWGSELYRVQPPRTMQVPIRAIPYYLWGNRGVGEMSVWMRTKP